MDVEEPLAVALDEARGQHAHEAGERHQARREALDLRGERGVEVFARRARAMFHDARRDAARRGDREALGFGAIADDRAHRHSSVEERLHVAAAPRDEDDDQS